MAKDIETLVSLHSAATGKAFAVLQVIADQSDSLGKAEILNKLLQERTRFSASSVYRAIKSLARLGELTYVDQHAQQRGNLYQIQVKALLSKPRRVVLTPLVESLELAAALQGQVEVASESSCQVDMSSGQKFSTSSCQGDMRLMSGRHEPSCHPDMSSNPVLNKDHARARAVPELLIHELNHELNSGGKISTGRKNSSPFASNSAKAAAFELTTDLREWAEANCPLVPVELTTQHWRDFVAKMADKVQKPVAHWRRFMRQQQTWREQEAKSRAEAYVGAGQSYQDRVPSVGSGANGAAVGFAGNSTATAAPLFDEVEAREAAITAALAQLTEDELANRQAEILTSLRGSVGEKWYLWTEEAITATVHSTLRKQIAAKLAA